MKKITILLFVSIIVLFFNGCSAKIEIPDAKFKSWLLSQFDTNFDGEISVAEAEAVTVMPFSGQGISDITGIEAFKNMTELKCVGNKLTKIPDLSSLEKLVYIICNGNMLTSLPALPPNIERIRCQKNQINNISELTHLLKLTDLDISYNNLEEKDCLDIKTLKDRGVSIMYFAQENGEFVCD